jgi:hypothetical protein
MLAVPELAGYLRSRRYYERPRDFEATVAVRLQCYYPLMVNVA